jgi:lysine-ketoglutarate reductase/saccharopine dehydrogenase-like protein (TIGR00300 family)
MKFSLPAFKHPDFTADSLKNAPECKFLPAPADFVAPEYYHATTIFPEYFKHGSEWLLAKESRMDSVAVLENGEIHVREFRNIKKGDLVATGRTEDGSEGIYVHPNCFSDIEEEEDSPQESFVFRQGRSRETAFSIDYDYLYELLKHERDNGYIVWVMGPACSFDADSRNAFSMLIEKGYVHALLAGNALATHDLEGAYKNTGLGQDIYTQESIPNGHYHHIDTINRARLHGSIEKFIEAENLDNGIIYTCVKKKIPMVLVGSIRDDGPLPGVIEDAYEGQEAMRAELKKATTVIAMASVLHTIAAGNISPMYRFTDENTARPVYFYTVDISEFAANKLADRGSLSAKSIITNAQDFLAHLGKALGE